MSWWPPSAAFLSAVWPPGAAAFTLCARISNKDLDNIKMPFVGSPVKDTGGTDAARNVYVDASIRNEKFDDVATVMHCG